MRSVTFGVAAGLVWLGAACGRVPAIPPYPGESFGTAGDSLRYPLTRPLPDPEDGTRYHRTLVAVSFDDEVMPETFWAVIRRQGGRLIGGYAEARLRVIEIPDPGATWEDLEAALDRWKSEPAVQLVVPIAYGMRSGLEPMVVERLDTIRR